ncbi:amidohydrolase 2 [Leucogyrophana mollusca]|uniref:Amidohydrolase 2 n=1 Tax=Leucogyrophana mollusca TaxID=85980 RepID=A0ACB8B4Q7_9AGAM|nr:amidohydrolase 2 [Leucogyrophana mollusca]
MSTLQNTRIDVHHHIFLDAQQKVKRNLEVGWRTPAENLPWCPASSIKAMNALGIQVAVLSPPPLSSAAPGPENRAAARQHNVYASQLCKAHPTRFGFFASLPYLDDVEGALAEITYAMDELNADGIAMLSSYGEGDRAKYIADDLYDPIWEELDKRHAVVFLHGAQTPSSTPYPHPMLGLPITEVPNETFKAASHLVVTGKVRRFRNVKVILAHFGGCTPFLAARVAVLSKHMGCPLSHDEILEDFASFYYETALSAHDASLAAMEKFVAPDHILFGTDFPAVSTKMVEWYTKNLEFFYAEDPLALENITRRNALALLPRLQKQLVSVEAASEPSSLKNGRLVTAPSHNTF